MSHAPSLQKPPKSAVRTLFNVTSDNFMEMHDFMVSGYYATGIAKTFFPGDGRAIGRRPLRVGRMVKPYQLRHSGTPVSASL